MGSLSQNFNNWLMSNSAFGVIPSLNFVFTQPWILNSRATDHITSDSTFFTKTESSPLPKVNLPTGSSTQSLQLELYHSIQTSFYTVLCVLFFGLNFIYVNEVTNSLNYCAILFPSFCVLQDLTTRKLIGSNKQHGGLYYTFLLRGALVSFQVSHSSKLWHMRLGNTCFFHIVDWVVEMWQ